MNTEGKKSFVGIAKNPILMLLLAYAGFAIGATDVANSPIPVELNAAQVQPNIMFTLDDSGSMHWEFLPEQDMHYSIFLHPRPNSPYGGSDYTNQVPTFDDDNVHNYFGRSAANNKMYYNPNITYKPWAKSDGTLMPDAPPTAAPYNPASAAAGTINLTAQQTVSAVWFYHKTSLTSSPSVAGSHTYWPITYYNYKGTGSRTAFASYNKVQITTSTSAGAVFTSPSGVTRTRDQEIQNFANWFTYYRSRILASRAGVGKAFSQLGTGPRVGFAAINQGPATVDGIASPGTLVTGVKPFTGTARQNFFDTLYGHVIPTAGTPLRSALDDVGKYFERTDNSGPWGPSPQLTCRASYNILMTDGYWNGASASTAAAKANVDNQTGPLILHPYDATKNYQYAKVAPYKDNYSDTLADISMYYWNRDLRTDLANEVPPNNSDPAFWQHLVNFTVGLGVTGTLNYPSDLAGLQSGALNWPDPALGNAQKLDDLWHAAVNSRGTFFSASDPDAFADSMINALNDITGRTLSFSATAVANPNITPADNVTYATSFNPADWSGEIKALNIDLKTGAISSTSNWSPGPQALLDGRTTTNSDTRLIATYNGSVGVPFEWSQLTATQQNQLHSKATPPGPTDGAAVLNYLRGWRANEGVLYRKRQHLLGDIVNAEAAVVGKPVWNYSDSGYSGFKGVSRSKMVYQGANDGMLHAIDAATGAEKWAYIPGLIIPTIGNLAKKVGFSHQFYVDGTPVVSDVDFSYVDGASSGTANWRSVLVGGLGKGGRGYYALDVTDPTAATQADVAKKVLWEFSDADMGYSFGKPVIVKTRAKKWVVLVTSGYNNVPEANGGAVGSTTGDGKGYLYVLNAKTGAQIAKIGTGSGSTANPSGLAYIAAFSEDTDTNNTVEEVYGGDLNGDVWRFDLSGASDSSWSVSKFASLTGPGGVPQPVTTIPETAYVTVGPSKIKMVYIGTGKYLGTTDVSSKDVQSMYGLRDSGGRAFTSGTPQATIDVAASRADGSLVQQTLTVSGTKRTGTANPVTLVGTSAKKGWYLDLPITGERSNTHPAVAYGLLTFTTNVPDSSPCSIYGGSSWINYIDYATGGAPKSQGKLATASFSLGATLASAAKVILVNGIVKAIGSKTDGTSFAGDPPPPFKSRRVSWKEITTQ